MHKIKLSTVGADPEFFIINKATAEPYSPLLFTSGTKEHPQNLGFGFGVMSDNLTIEGNMPYVRTEEDFIKNVKHLKIQIQRLLDTYQCILLCEGELMFPPAMAETSQGQEFGCSSIYYAWDSFYDVFSNDCENFIRRSPKLDDSNLRTAGFHIHIGYKVSKPLFTKNTYDVIIARLFDFFVTLPAINMHYEPFRLANYGFPGNFRSKSYGVECRTLSSYFAQDEYLPWIYGQLVKMFEYLNTLTEEEIKALLGVMFLKHTCDNVEDFCITIYQTMLKKLPTIKEIVKDAVIINKTSKTHEQRQKTVIFSATNN